MGMQDREWYRQEQREKRQKSESRPPLPLENPKKSPRLNLTTPIFLVLASAMLAAILWL
ncbi:enoyl-CoA hydratase [Pseudomonas sp. TCU-HL1]|uniref:enoyl-CoA hydratase n=1 Tax=Pseudomonas sp. TCU-HL1 TaxID=1856685 RepID=UPI0008578B54|nr:enoyl-CoA hydratase [Pseudomonas sp. TCU-HL1]AOE85615.1 hypothetical protein THL1_3067 [Pseudomonas sp. TCU-HL1]